VSDSFLAAIHADGPAADRVEQMALYGQFVGGWSGSLRFRDDTGEWRRTSAEVHFGWVLEGRAIQDVWIAPARADDPGAALRMYGTTIRVYVPGRDEWEITWIDPNRRRFDRMRGRCVGDEIVQDARLDDGALSQWIFTDITANSFRWLSRRSEDDGRTWADVSEFRFERSA
jgi:hypothetical protein